MISVLSIYPTIQSGLYEGLVVSQTECEEQEKAQDLHELHNVPRYLRWYFLREPVLFNLFHSKECIEMQVSQRFPNGLGIL